jgi:hypothetical protein
MLNEFRMPRDGAPPDVIRPHGGPPCRRAADPLAAPCRTEVVFTARFRMPRDWASLAQLAAWVDYTAA